MYSVFVLLLLLHCFIFIIVLLLCCVSRSSLYSNIPSDLCTLSLSCYYFYIVLSLYLYCCYVVYLDHHFTVISLQTCVLCVFLVITSTLFYFILVLLLCCVSRSSLYCNIPSDFERLSWPRSYGSWIYNYLCKSVPYIITDFVNSNLDQGEVYNIM